VFGDASSGDLSVRGLSPTDAEPARALLVQAYGATPYAPRWIEVLEHATNPHDHEHRAIVILRGSAMAGLVLLGDVSGAPGVRRVHVAVLASDDHPLREAARHVLLTERRGCRLLVAEMADDPVLSPAIALLSVIGFREEARIPAFYTETIALRFLRLDL
jgi:hypothetical protein